MEGISMSRRKKDEIGIAKSQCVFAPAMATAISRDRPIALSKSDGNVPRAVGSRGGKTGHESQIKARFEASSSEQKKTKKKKKKEEEEEEEEEEEDVGAPDPMYRSDGYWVGETFNIRDILFTPERDFLVKHNGDKVLADHLNGKSVVVYIWNLIHSRGPGDTRDILDAYERCGGSFEVVFVGLGNDDDESRFYAELSTMSCPAVPFSDRQACLHIEKAFRRDTLRNVGTSFWAIVEPTNKLMFVVDHFLYFFQKFDGSELVPLTYERLVSLDDEDEKAVQELPRSLDQLLTCPGLDYLHSSDGKEVPISSLKDKVVGLYFCENKAYHPRMESIKKVYDEAQARKYPFEIVQINIHFTGKYGQQCNETIPWLVLPFKDKRARRLCRVFELDDPSYQWSDRLVIIARDQPNLDGTFIELSGAEIMTNFGIKAYPFTRRVIYEMESKRLKEEVKLQSIFPPGCSPPLIRPRGTGAGGGCDDQDAVTHLLGKRVLLLFADHSKCNSSGSEFVSMLKSKYSAQLQEVGEKNKFEVVFMSLDKDGTSFEMCIKDMPWLVYPYKLDFALAWWTKIWANAWRLPWAVSAVFFEKGELLTKAMNLEFYDLIKPVWSEFPFIPCDLESNIQSDLILVYGLQF